MNEQKTKILKAPSTVKMILDLFNRQERQQMYLIFAAMVVRGLFEVVGVASIMPFMAVVANDGVVQTNKYLSWAYMSFGFDTPRQFLLALGLVAFFILVFNNILAAITDWFLVKFTLLRGHALAQRLLAGYMSRSYAWFLTRNTADMGANILNEVANYMKGVLRPFMEMLAKGIVSLFICALLLQVDALLAVIVALVLGGAYGGIFYFVRKRLTRAGKDRVYDSRRQFKYINEALTGIKDIKVLGREQYFFNSFSKHSYRANYNQAIYQIVSQLPRYALELIAFGGILLIVLYFIAVRQNTENIIALIALYAFAGYRLMPALQGVFGGITSLKFNISVLHRIREDLSKNFVLDDALENWNDVQSILPLSDKIELKNIEFAYPGNDTSVLNKLKLTISANSTIGLVGTTGAGKTTLVDILLGLFSADRGKLIVDGQVIDETNRRAWQRNIGYVPQHIFLCDDTVARNIAFGLSEDQVNREAIERAACIADIHDFILNELPDGYDTVIGERGVRLSGGQRQRLGIARAMYHDPGVLILDEATSSLDGVTESNVIKAIHSLADKKTIIMIAHRLTTLKECDIIHFLHQGTLLDSGTYQQLYENCEEFNELVKVTEKTSSNKTL